MPRGMTKARKTLECQCPRCFAEWPWKIRRFANRAGHLTFPYVCNECGYKSSVLERKATVMQWIQYYGLTVEDVPILPSSSDVPVCEVCGKEGAELHHYAPQHLFDNADDWPTGYLCLEHHREWHQKIKGHK